MSWVDVVRKNKAKIIETWFNKVIETYPEETSKFLKSQENPFLNPVGGAIKEGLEGIVDWIVAGDPSSRGVSAFLDRIIRIRAIQEFAPSGALGFISDLRAIVRNICRESAEQTSYDFLATFDGLVDRLLMECFNVYVKCREDLYQIRIDEVKNRSFRLLQRAGLLCEIEESKDKDSDDLE